MWFWICVIFVIFSIIFLYLSIKDAKRDFKKLEQNRVDIQDRLNILAADIVYEVGVPIYVNINGNVINFTVFNPLSDEQKNKLLNCIKNLQNELTLFKVEYEIKEK